MRAFRALTAALLFLVASAARAEGECVQVCRDESRACRERCVKDGASSEEQMQCRSQCLREDDSCRCECGERTYCERGNKGMRGCGILVAQKDAQPGTLVAQKDAVPAPRK